MRRMTMKMSNGELYDDVGYDKGYNWIRSNYSLFQMFFWNSHSKSQKSIWTKILKGSTAGIWPRELLLCRRQAAWSDLSSFPHFVFISSFCLALLALVSNFFIIMCACNPHHRFWIPLAVTLTWWAVIFLSAGNYRSSYCKILLESKLSNIQIYFQHSSSGRPGSGLHSTLCYLQVTKALLAIY